MCAKDIVNKCAHSLWYACFAYPPCVPPPPTHTSSFICRVSSCYHQLTVMPKCLLSLIPPLYILAILNTITTTTATTNLYRLPRSDLIEWVFVGRSFGKDRASHGCRDRRANVHEERVPSLPAPTTCAGRAPEAVCRPSRRQSRGHHYPGRAIRKVHPQLHFWSTRGHLGNVLPHPLNIYIYLFLRGVTAPNLYPLKLTASCLCYRMLTCSCTLRRLVVMTQVH